MKYAELDFFPKYKKTSNFQEASLRKQVYLTFDRFVNMY